MLSIVTLMISILFVVDEGTIQSRISLATVFSISLSNKIMLISIRFLASLYPPKFLEHNNVVMTYVMWQWSLVDLVISDAKYISSCLFCPHI